jgi:pimeloyl-ACP methyl ester carboxylesterase
MSIVASPPPLGPDDLTFYDPSDEQLKGNAGEVIWVRPLTGAAALTAAASNELVLYRSRDIRGQPIAVSGIIALPPKPVPPGGYSVITWAHGTVGCADRCAPSRDVETSDTHAFNSYVHLLLNEFLNAGWAVVMTDYEGLGTKGLHPYQLGESEARGILDIVLAARSFHPELSNRLAIVGHSQGGQAALFAAHHHGHTAGWKPEIDLRGVAALAPASCIKTLVSLSTRQDLTAGGEPPPEPVPSDPGEEVDVAEGQAFTALFIAGAIGGDPTIQLAEILTDTSLARWKHLEERCRVGLSAEDSWGGLDWSDQLRSTPSDSRTKLIQQLGAMHPAVPIDVPIRISQAALDKRVLAAFTLILKNDLVSKPGNQVEYEPYLFVAPTLGKFAGLGAHFGLLDTDRGKLVTWLKARFGEAAS